MVSLLPAKRMLSTTLERTDALAVVAVEPGCNLRNSSIGALQVERQVGDTMNA